MLQMTVVSSRQSTTYMNVYVRIDFNFIFITLTLQPPFIHFGGESTCTSTTKSAPTTTTRKKPMRHVQAMRMWIRVFCRVYVEATTNHSLFKMHSVRQEEEKTTIIIVRVNTVVLITTNDYDYECTNINYLIHLHNSIQFNSIYRYILTDKINFINWEKESFESFKTKIIINK